MQQIKTLSPLSSHRILKIKIENKEKNNRPYYKSTNNSKEKTYYFRTSLFTEKSKKIVQKMNSSQPKMSKDIYKKKKLNSSSIKPGCRTSFKKTEKIFIFDNNNENIEKIKSIKNNHFVVYLDKNGKNDNLIDVAVNQRLRKSNNNLININFNNNNNTEIKKNQSSIRENEFKKEDNIKKKYIIVSVIKKYKLFSNINNVVINNKNNKKIISNNYNGQSQSKINDKIINANAKREVSNQNKQIKKSNYNKKTKYRLKSRKSLKNKKENVNANAISYKSINIKNNNNLKKELKGIKSISKYSKILPTTIFDKSNYISKYQLGNYNTERKNDRYGSKNSTIDEKKNRRKFIQNGIINIVSLKDKNDIRFSRKGKIV